MASHIRAAPPCLPDDLEEVRNRQLYALIPTTVVLALSLLTYGLRLLARKRTGQLWRLDDILMGVGLFIFLEPAICEYLFPNGLGHHICNVPNDQKQRFSKISFALQRANQPALACVKISILVFYMRIFSVRPFRIAVYVNIAYTIIWAIATWVINLTVCTPIAYYYDKTIPGGYCRNQAVSGSISGALSLLGDIAILVLPLPMIWNLKINLRKKIALVCVFMLGLFTIRIVELTKFVVADATYSQVYASTWTTLEQGVAVISGNLPPLAPLFEGFFRNRGSTARSKGYMYESKNKTASSASRSRHEKGARSVDWTGRRGGVNHEGSEGRGVRGVRRDSDRFDEVSDIESQTRSSSHTEFEMDDRTILVRTEVIVSEDVVSGDGEQGGSRQAGPAETGSRRGWSGR